MKWAFQIPPTHVRYVSNIRNNRKIKKFEDLKICWPQKKNWKQEQVPTTWKMNNFKDTSVLPHVLGNKVGYFSMKGPKVKNKNAFMDRKIKYALILRDFNRDVKIISRKEFVKFKIVISSSENFVDRKIIKILNRNKVNSCRTNFDKILLPDYNSMDGANIFTKRGEIRAKIQCRFTSAPFRKNWNTKCRFVVYDNNCCLKNWNSFSKISRARKGFKLFF